VSTGCIPLLTVAVLYTCALPWAGLKLLQFMLLHRGSGRGKGLVVLRTVWAEERRGERHLCLGRNSAVWHCHCAGRATNCVHSLVWWM